MSYQYISCRVPGDILGAALARLVVVECLQHSMIMKESVFLQRGSRLSHSFSSQRRPPSLRTWRPANLIRVALLYVKVLCRRSQMFHTPCLNPIQLATRALGARHALPQHHAFASKDRDVNTVIPLVFLSSPRARGRPAYTRALSDARTTAHPTPDLSSPDLTPVCSSSTSPIRNIQPTILSAHSATATVVSNKQISSIQRETIILAKLEA